MIAIAFLRKDDHRDALRNDAQGRQVQTEERGFWHHLFDPHRKIERWGMRFTIAVSLLCVFTLTSMVHAHREQVRQEMMVNSVGTTVNFSKSPASFTLKKTVMSKDGKWAFIPFNFSNIKRLPHNPNDYQVLVQAKGSSHATLSYKPITRLVLFGSSGKGIIVMYSASGIQNQPLTMYMINLKNLSKGDSGDYTTSDTSNASTSDIGLAQLGRKYDILSFSVNPGAENVRKGKRTDATLSDKGGLYMAVFGGVSESSVNRVINRDNKKIKNTYGLVNEDRSKLQAMGYEVPDDPAWMKDDWRPFDAVDLNTGKSKDGKSALDIATGNTSDTTDDKDAVKFPATLKGHGSVQMKSADSNDGNNSDDGTSPNGGIDDGSQFWQDLQSQWNKVHDLKRDIYVTQYAKLYEIRFERNQLADQTNVGASNKNLPISTIKIRKMTVEK